MSVWPKVKLGDVLRYRKEFITIEDLQDYRRPRVQLHAQGIVLRDTVAGAFIKTKRQQVCRAGEFLVAEIDAKVGGFGIVPSGLHGSIVSSHYFLFVIDEAKLNRTFLDYFIRTPAFREQIAAQGSTNYAAIRPSHVLSYQIPLPPLAMQQQVVAQIDELASQIREVHTLRREEETEMQQILLGSFRRIADGAPQRQMREIAPLVRRPIAILATENYPEIGIRSFGKGTFHKPALSGFELGNKRVFKIHAGDLLFSNVFAWEGAMAVAKQEDAGRVGSHRYISCVPKQEVTTSRFLCFYFQTAEGLGKIQEASPGGAGRNRTLGIGALESIEVPIPSIKSQQWFNELQTEMEALKRLHVETAAELDAILPAVLDRAFQGPLVLADLTETTRPIRETAAHIRMTFGAEDYFLQLIPALLRAAGGRLELDHLNAAVALLFLPKVLHPLIASVGGADARVHFERFNQPLKDSAFVPMLHVLIKTGAITCEVANRVTSLHLHESAAPPIQPVVEEDARLLAATVNLIPPSPVQATVSKLCPKPEELLAMS